MSRLCALLVLALALVGCKPPKRRPVELSPELAAAQAQLTKLHGYIECLDQHSARVFEISDLYIDRFEATAPTPETNLLLQAPTDPEVCLQLLLDAKLLQPAMPEVERAGEAFGRALGQVFVLTTEAGGYYDREHTAYAPVKGVALHPQLMAAFGAFDTAQGELFDQVYRLNRVIHAEQLEREEAAGRKLFVVAERMMFEAEALVRFAATPWDHVNRLDQAGFLAQLGVFENAIEEMTAYAHAQPAETTKWEYFWSFEDYARAYLITAKELAHRARGNVPYTDAEKIMIGANNEAAVTGTPAAMIKSYNRLVELW